MPVLYPGATYLPISVNHGPTSYNPSGLLHDIRGGTPHVQVGYGSLYGRFNDPSVQASSHVWFGIDGHCEQYVSLDIMSWAQGSGNPFFFTAEFEGMDTELMTPAQLDAGGAFFAYTIANLVKWPVVVNTDPNSSGLTPHFAGGAAWGGHSCPGTIRFQQYPDLVIAINRHLAAPIPPPDPGVDVVKVTYVSVAGGPVYLAGDITPRHVDTFAASDYVASHYGWQIEPPPPGTEVNPPIMDGAGGTRAVWGVSPQDANMFGL